MYAINTIIDMEKIWRTAEKHLIQSWECSRCYHCPLTLTVPVPVDRFLQQPPVILCLLTFFDPLSLSMCTFFDHLSLNMFTPYSGQAGSVTNKQPIPSQEQFSTNERRALVHMDPSFLIPQVGYLRYFLCRFSVVPNMFEPQLPDMR